MMMRYCSLRLLIKPKTLSIRQISVSSLSNSSSVSFIPHYHHRSLLLKERRLNNNQAHHHHHQQHTTRAIAIVSTMGSVFGIESVEEPPFTVVLERSINVDTTYQIRQYGKRMAVETIENRGANDSSAFSKLAKYIGVFGSPENEAQESIAMTAPVAMDKKVGGTKIAMTAPVVMDKKEGESNNKSGIMQFMLPAKYDSMEKVPKPTDPDVHVKELPPVIGVAHRYSGSFDSKLCADNAVKLHSQLQKDGLTMLSEEHVLSNYQFWGYNPPFCLPMFRRNEVWIPLTQAEADQLVNSVGKTTDETSIDPN